MDKWDKRFLAIAYDVALWSKDPDKKVGALAVSPDKRTIVTAYNGPIASFNDASLVSLSKEEKNSMTVHAEVNLIINAKRSLDNWALYITETPCKGCALALAQLGSISKVVCPIPLLSSSWCESQKQGLRILQARTPVIELYERGQYENTNY